MLDVETSLIVVGSASKIRSALGLHNREEEKWDFHFVLIVGEYFA